MATYGISQVLQQDILQIANMSSRFTTADPLTNVMLRDPRGVFMSPIESRRDVALHNYYKGLMGSIGPITNSFLLKSYSHCAPQLTEASAWIQQFHPNQYWHVPWKDEPGTFDIPPDCVNANLYYYIENALHTNRKTYMQGKEHYYIRQLDFRVFELQTPGKEAAKYLLACISKIHPQVDKYAHFTLAHQDLLQGLGWEHLGHVTFNPEFARDGSLLTVPQSTRSWVLRGVPHSNKAAAPAVSNSDVPPKPDFAGLGDSYSFC